jgi:hypothetical protein
MSMSSIGAWAESKHPRDEKGRFSSTGSSGADIKTSASTPASPRPLFDASKISSLPQVVTQPSPPPPENKDAIDKLVHDAKEAHNHSLDILNHGNGLDKALGATVVRGDKGERFGDLTKVKGPVVLIGPMKDVSGARAQEKVSAELGGKWEHLSDIVRSSIAVDSHKEIPGILQKLEASGITLARQPKDRFVNPTPGGYRDVLLNVRYPNGHVGEIQIHSKALLTAKESGGGHKLYEAQRSIDARAKNEGREKTHEEMKEIDRLNAEAHKIYDAAWAKSQ